MENIEAKAMWKRLKIWWSFELRGKCLDVVWNESKKNYLENFPKNVSNIYKVSFKVLAAMLKNCDEELSSGMEFWEGVAKNR